jgi:hypothetical protein
VTEHFTVPIQIELPDDVDPWEAAQEIWNAVAGALGAGSGARDLDASTADNKSWRRSSISELKVALDAHAEIPESIYWHMSTTTPTDPEVSSAIVMTDFYRRDIVASKATIRLSGSGRISTEHVARSIVDNLVGSSRLHAIAPSMSAKIEGTEIHSRDDAPSVPRTVQIETKTTRPRPLSEVTSETVAHPQAEIGDGVALKKSDGPHDRLRVWERICISIVIACFSSYWAILALNGAVRASSIWFFPFWWIGLIGGAFVFASIATASIWIYLSRHK